MSLRVCMLTTSFPRHENDFAGVFVQTLAQCLAERGVTVDVVAPDDGRAPRYEDQGKLRVHRFTYVWPRAWQGLAYGAGIPNNVRRRPLLLLQVLPFLVTFLWKAWRVCRDCDIVHVHWAPLAWLGLILRWRFRIPMVVTVHGTDVRSLPALLIRTPLDRADAVIAPTEEMEALLADMGISDCHPIPLPVDEEKFGPEVDRESAAKRTGLPLKGDVVTFVGRLSAFKDPKTFVRAVPHVLSRRPQTDFVIVGDGPLFEDVRALVTDLNVEHAVHLAGMRRDVENFLALSKLFVALSPIENVWSMTIAEAMHTQVPCIITRAGRTEQVFTHLENGYLIPPQDEEALADGIVELLSHEQRRRDIVDGALALLEAYGKDSRSIVQRTMAVYQSIVDEEAATR